MVPEDYLVLRDAMEKLVRQEFLVKMVFLVNLEDKVLWVPKVIGVQLDPKALLECLDLEDSKVL